MTFISKLALVIAFGSIMFSLFVVFNRPEAVAQAARFEFPLTERLDDAAHITMMLPVGLAVAATFLALSQLREDYAGSIFVLVALSWMVLIAVVGVHGLIPK